MLSLLFVLKPQNTFIVISVLKLIKIKIVIFPIKSRNNNSTIFYWIFKKIIIIIIIIIANSSIKLPTKT